MKNIIKTLLVNRGIKTEKQQDEFYNPIPPYDLLPEDIGIDKKQLRKGAIRIIKAIKNREKIIVYGDYDVDGISATAILWETLDFLGANAIPYIPDRFREGYGLNEESIKKLKKEDPSLSLIVTVDHGIVATGKIDFAKELDIDVVITDHHLLGESMPNAYAIIHTTQVSGSAVSWFLSRELLKINRNKTFGLLPQDHLGLAALGTITDVLPLVGFNRSIVIYGLIELRNSNRIGLIAICEEAVINQKELNTRHIGFVIGPRLNAAGRVEHAMDALRLICTRDYNRGRDLAKKLSIINKIRQEKTEAALIHVNESYEPIWVNQGVPKLLFAYHESYSEGVVGIVAGRLTEKYYRPTIVLSRGEKLSKASARSVQGVDIIKLIKKAGNGLLIGAGGHPMAAGFSVKTEDLDKIVQRFAEVAKTYIEDKSLIKNTRVDCVLRFNQINQQFYSELEKFNPYGFGNPEPTFETLATAQDLKTVGKTGEHLKLVLVQGDNCIKAIAFRMGDLYKQIKPNKPVKVIYSIEKDEWSNSATFQLKVRQIILQE